jgi:hypothetical protein
MPWCWVFPKMPFEIVTIILKIKCLVVKQMIRFEFGF